LRSPADPQRLPLLAAFGRPGHGAPWIAFSIETSHDFFSARTGCQVYQPVYGIDLGALCLRR
jgi:hypothetical protein